MCGGGHEAWGVGRLPQWQAEDSECPEAGPGLPSSRVLFDAEQAEPRDRGLPTAAFQVLLQRRRTGRQLHTGAETLIIIIFAALERTTKYSTHFHFNPWKACLCTKNAPKLRNPPSVKTATFLTHDTFKIGEKIPCIDLFSE